MIDWLKFKVNCLHTPLPRNGALISYDENGVVEWEKPRPTMITGSFDHRVKVQSTGPLTDKGLCTEFEVDGNITKFLQGHNVWGTDDHIGLVRSFIEWLFNNPKSPLIPAPGVISSDLDPSKFVCNRIDITHYMDVGGRHNVRTTLDALTTDAHTKYQRANNHKGTVYINKNSRRWSFKFYDKYQETAGRSKARSLTCTGFDQNQQQLIRDSVSGMVRAELVLRLMELRELEIVTLGQIKPNVLYKDYLKRISTEANVRMNAENIDKTPAKLRLTYTAWEAGHDLLSMMSKASYYRHKKELKQHGIDISQPPKSNEKSSTVVSLVRYIEAMPAAMPSDIVPLIHVPNRRTA